MHTPTPRINQTTLKLLWMLYLIFSLYLDYCQLIVTFTQPSVYTGLWLSRGVAGSDLTICCFVLQMNLATNALPAILFHSYL